MIRLALALPALLTTPALAFVPWDNPNGQGSFFSWSDGGSDDGRFGSPILLHDDFLFFSAFHADAIDAQSRQSTDLLRVRLYADQGRRFEEISVTETIHYTITGAGGSVSASLLGFVHDLDNFARESMASAASPPDLTGSGTLTLSATYRLDGPLDWTRLSLTMRQTLTATAGDVGSAHIDATLITLHIPTPATLALLSGLLLLRRSRT